jgi:hypothetical protein
VGPDQGNAGAAEPKGTPNRATVERAAITACATAEVGHRLAKETLAKYMNLFDELADTHRLRLAAPSDTARTSKIFVIGRTWHLIRSSLAAPRVI